MVKNLPAMQETWCDPWVGNEMFLVKQNGGQRAVLCLSAACCLLPPVLLPLGLFLRGHPELQPLPHSSNTCEGATSHPINTLRGRRSTSLYLFKHKRK